MCPLFNVDPGYSELTLFETAKERRRAMLKATLECGVARMVVAVMVGSVFYSLFFECATLRFLAMLPGDLPHAVTFAIRIASNAMFFFPIIMLATRGNRKRTEHSLRRQLTEKGIVVCMECGYDLRGCPSGRCPECGAEFDVSSDHGRN